MYDVTDDGLIYYPDGNDDYFIELNEPIPTSYVEGGIRHIIVRDEDMLVRYKLEDGQLIETAVF